MKRKFHYLVLLASLALPCPRMLHGATASLTVHADQPGARINPAMWGIFFEDINFGADGGLYAELVKNRSFRGDIVLPAKLDGAEGKRLYASATRDDKTGEVIAKLVNGDDAPADVSLNLAGKARLIVLTGANRAEENSLAEPTKIAPKESKLTLAAGKPLSLPANSMTVLRVSLGK